MPNAIDVEDGSLEQSSNLAPNELQRAPRIDAEKTLRSESKFLADLRSCTNLHDLHSWASDYGVALQRYSRLSFRHLCQCDQDLEVALEALGDQALNSHGNLEFLLWRIAIKPLEKDDADILAQWLKRTLFLGQRSELQIKLLVDFVSRLGIANCDEDLKCSLAASVFEGLELSRVLSIGDLNPSIIGMLLQAITSGNFTNASLDLGIRVINALGPRQLRSVTHGISLLLQKELISQMSMHRSAASKNQQKYIVPRSFQILRDLPLSASSAVILETSEALIKQAACLSESNDPLLHLLGNWWSWTRGAGLLDHAEKGSGEKKIEQLLARTDICVMVTYLRQLDDLRIAQFLLHNELGMQMKADNRLRVFEEFRHICHFEKDVSPFVSLLRAAHTHSDVPERSMLRIFRLLQILQKSNSIADVIVGLRAAGFKTSEQVISSTIRNGLHDKHFRVEKILKVFRELPLEKCPEVAERMIKNVKRQPIEALKLYRTRHPGVSSGCREPPETINARAEVLQRMAISYSTAVHLTPRMAFKYVYQCYVYHMREKLGTVGRGMVLSLIRSGIVRLLQEGQWVSTMRLTWILNLVRKSEGDQVADQIDRVIYDWRGKVIKKIQADHHRRKNARLGVKESPMSFTISNRWNNSQGHIDKILTPINNDRLRLLDSFAGLDKNPKLSDIEAPQGLSTKVTCRRIPGLELSAAMVVKSKKALRRHRQDQSLQI